MRGGTRGRPSHWPTTSVSPRRRARPGWAWPRTLLFAGKAAAAQQAITDARDHPFPPTQPDIALVNGIIGLRNDDSTAAANAFRDALTRADQQLTDTPGNYTALDTTALAHTGLLVLTDDPAHAAQAIAAFRAATSAGGIVQGALRIFDALTAALHHIRTAAAGTRAM